MLSIDAIMIWMTSLGQKDIAKLNEQLLSYDCDDKHILKATEVINALPAMMQEAYCQGYAAAKRENIF